MSTALRLVFVAVILVAFQGGVWAYLNVGLPAKPYRFNHLPDELPMQLGEWMGENCEMDSRLGERFTAEQIVNRTYRDLNGHEISLHLAVWGDFARAVHPPKGCFRGSGLDLIKEERILITGANGESVEACLLTYGRDGQTAFVLYWFEVGQHIAHSLREIRSAQYSFRGADSWPLTMKVMLQTRVQDRQQAVQCLREVAGHVHEQTRDL